MYTLKGDDTMIIPSTHELQAIDGMSIGLWVLQASLGICKSYFDIIAAGGLALHAAIVEHQSDQSTFATGK